MSSRQTVQALIAETAPLLELASVTAYDDRDAWLLAFDDETMLDIEHDAVEDRLVIAGGIWVVADAARLAVYEMLLQYNYLWTETGGLRMALDGLPGQVVLMFELPVSGIGASRLSRVLDKMAGIQRTWRQALQQFEQADLSDAHGPGGLLLDPDTVARLVVHP